MDFNYAAIPDGAVAHRNYYRGKDLTYAFNDGTFSANVRNGTFRDIFPGDYIVKKITVPAVAYTKTSTYKVKFIIADLDIAMNQGSPMVKAHHAVIVPERLVFSTYMNPTDTNADGYAGSYMHKTVMPAFAQGLTGAFGEKHLLKCSFDGADSASSDQLFCTCRLMTLSMVCGKTPPWWGGFSLSDFDKDSCLGEVQFAAFRLHPNLKFTRVMYWLSDAYSSAGFVIVVGLDDAFGAGASTASRDFVGVRPFTLLV